MRTDRDSSHIAEKLDETSISSSQATGQQATKGSGRAPSQVLAYIGVLGTFFGVLGVLFGSGILNRPHLVIQSGSVDMAMPAEFKMKLFFNQWLMQIPEQQRAVRENYRKALLSLGMPVEKVKVLVAQFKDPTADAQVPTPSPELPLQPNEKHMVMTALSQAMLATTMDMNKLMTIPDKVSFYSITNSGRADAKNVRITIRVPGPASEQICESDNTVGSQNIASSVVTIELPVLSAGSKVEGRVWYTDGSNFSVFQTGIAIAYEGGVTSGKLESNWSPGN